MSELSVVVLSRDEARSLTDEVKRDAERLWSKLVELYEGAAHIALGFETWAQYFEAEFGGSPGRASQILNAGRVARELEGFTNGKPANERQARELAPLLDQPEQLREAWGEATENGQPTAEQVREAVGRYIQREPRPVVMAGPRDQHETMVRVWDNACRVLDDDAPNAAAKVEHLTEYDGPGPITPERLDRVAAFAEAAAKALRKEAN